MNKEKLEEQIGILFKVVDKLEQRISSLEKFWLVMLNVLDN